MKRIALYGGTFDPVHVGHIAVARELLRLFALDEVLFIPAFVAPHKREREVTPALQRYAMLALATQDDPRLSISTVELDEPAKPYTFETLGRMQSSLGDASLFFIMGADSWMEIGTWREWERVLEMSNHVVVTRPGYELSIEHVPPAVRARVVDLRGLGLEAVAREINHNSDRLKIYVTDAVARDVSATEIRALVRAGDRSAEIARLVPPPVASFIEKYKLYRKS